MGDLYLATRSPEHLLVRCCDRKMRSCEFLNLKSMVREGEVICFIVNMYRVYVLQRVGVKVTEMRYEMIKMENIPKRMDILRSQMKQ